MKKEEAVRIITSAAKTYENNFKEKNFLIIFGSEKDLEFIETKATVKNFHHLTGVKLNKTSLLRDIDTENSNELEVFYEKAKNNKLRQSDFEFKRDGTTVQKMDVLIQAMNLTKNAKMIGVFSNGRLHLKTDKLVGGFHSCIKFVKDGNFYYPNTVPKDDIRKNVVHKFRVLAVLKTAAPCSQKTYW